MFEGLDAENAMFLILSVHLKVPNVMVSIILIMDYVMHNRSSVCQAVDRDSSREMYFDRI